MKIEIEDLKKVKLHPDDVLMISFDPDIEDDTLFGTVDALRETFPRNKLMFIPSTMKIEVIEKND